MAFLTPMALVTCAPDHPTPVVAHVSRRQLVGTNHDPVRFVVVPTTIVEPAMGAGPAPARAPRTSHEATSPPLGGRSAGGTLATIRQCESGGNYATNTGNGYYGAYQATLGAWGGYGGYARADLAPAGVQDRWAAELLASAGTAPWPTCGRRA